eukprot:357102-Chlamydomonas_euryale.AAC.1
MCGVGHTCTGLRGVPAESVCARDGGAGHAGSLEGPSRKKRLKPGRKRAFATVIAVALGTAVADADADADPSCIHPVPLCPPPHPPHSYSAPLPLPHSIPSLPARCQRVGAGKRGPAPPVAAPEEVLRGRPRMPPHAHIPARPAARHTAGGGPGCHAHI